MPSEDATYKSPRLHDIDTSSADGVSGPFWDASDRCFWLMNNRQIYTHPENYSGSSACATIASANPDSAYPSGWSRGQRTRSLSGSDTSLNSASHESKRIRPDSLGGVPVKSTGSKQHSRRGTPEQQRRFPQYDLSNLPPPPPFPPQRSHSVRFSPDISYSDDPVRNRNPGASQPSFPQRSQSVRIFGEREQIFTRSSSQSPSNPSSSSSYSHHKPLPTRTHSTSTSNPVAPTTSALKHTTTHTTTYSTLPPSTRYTPPRYLQDREHEDEDFSSASSASSAYSYNKSPTSPSHRPRDRHESQRLRTHHRQIEYDYDTESEITSQKEKKLRRSGSGSGQKSTRTAEEQKKHEKTLKSIGETGRGDMGRAAFMTALPFVCLFAKLAA
ncbi:4f38c897-33cc-40b2-a3a1-42157d495fbb [Sclerotinia trifoliorum]|uniref:4f38c897-33cc-40b2-a3a1-42157d495fbb n=1 Tax=Sclerotinia trifoliorum TaxID=28548 RepID=A0A8H2W1Z0_9HELO|nr:4f38c897-33cc-40b2-a3a1-42157d495fbb [Sclerotinia trifoliorum]